MATPQRGKSVVESTDRLPRHFRWCQPFEDTLLDLLVRETRKGNRPDASFTSTAFRNVVTDFNRLHGATIMKKHVLSRIKTMKNHFHLFHGAFNGLSGFSWNPETKMFEAEDYLWEQRIMENLKLEKFRDKACHNWDKLFELYGDTRATGAGASGVKEQSIKLQRILEFTDLGFEKDNICSAVHATEASSFGEHDISMFDFSPTSTSECGSTQKSGGSSKGKLKRKSSLISVMENGYKTIAASIEKLSTAMENTGEKVAGSKFDVPQNSMIFDALSSLGLDAKYKIRCYKNLCANPSKAALLVAAPNELRGELLEDIMADTGDNK